MNRKKSKSASGKTGKFFTGHGRGENAEVKDELGSPKKDVMRSGLKKAIAMQAAGSDVSALFDDVARLFQHSDFAVKKLVYLFIINFSQTNPDKAMDIANSIQRDARDPSPVLRALALRTLSSIHTHKVVDYMVTPLRDGLKDHDPYVRKTATNAVTKLWLLDKDLTEKEGFISKLRDLMSDPNPMVVSNAVAGLAEISAFTGEDQFEINTTVMAKLLTALKECTEWGQVFILDALATYRPAPDEAERTVERVTPFLQHANAAVAMSAVKVIFSMLSVIDNPPLEKNILMNKLPPPLITLLSDAYPELQYTALRNIGIIVQRYPMILTKDVKHFFVKYNDPSYIKMEKLAIMTELIADENVEQVLAELREYAKEVDVGFVRKAVAAIGRCAIKVPDAAERSVKILLELIQTKVNYVVQEAIIVIKDIFRKYPNKYESIIATLCENLDTLDEPEAKASMIWIIGEYAGRIENVPALLEDFVETLPEETPRVQLQLLTAVVKFFLRRPDEAGEMVKQVLEQITDHADNPDLRDRGYVYWRLLSTNVEIAQQVVLAEKPPISDTTFNMDKNVLDLLIANLSSLSSVYYKPPEQFVKGGRTVMFKGEGKEEEDSDSSDSSSSESSDSEDSDDDDDDDGEDEKAAPPQTSAPIELDFLTDLAGDMSVDTASSSSKLAKAPVVLARDNPKVPGLQLRAEFERKNGRVVLNIRVENNTQSHLQAFAIKFNKNYWGLTAGPMAIPGGVPVNGSGEAAVFCTTDSAADAASKPNAVQVAIKTDLGVAFFLANVNPLIFTEESGKLEQTDFLSLWKDLGNNEEKMALSATISDVSTVERALRNHNVFVVAKRSVPNKGDCLYCSSRVKGQPVLLEVSVNNSVNGAGKSNDSILSKAVLYGVLKALA